jgi:DNA invertase Pin-like site-specific DNA recombinase
MNGMAPLVRPAERGFLRLDRLARSSRDLHNILHELQERSSGFVSPSSSAA